MESHRDMGGMWLLPVWFTTAFALLGLAWAGGNPPAAAPDEQAHFIKAYATADRQVFGDRRPIVATSSPGETEAHARSSSWIATTSRWFFLPERVVPPGSAGCYAFDRERTADCQDFSATSSSERRVAVSTHVGTYNPFPYVIPGLAMQGASAYREAAWRGRLAGLLVCTVLLGWAAWLLGRSGPFMLVALIVATTPMVVFLASSLNTSGLEIAAAILYWSAALTMLRAPFGNGASAWGAFAVGGVALAMTRPLGAILLGVSVPFLVCIGGIGHGLEAVRRTPRRAAVAIILVAAGCTTSFYWAHVEIPHPSIDYGLALASLGRAIRDLPNQAREVVGIFGWNDTTMPMPFYLLGLALLSGLGGLALRFGSAFERLALIGLGLAILSIDLALAVLVEAQIGFGMQARYLMPLTVGLCLFSGHIVQRESSRLSRVTSYRLASAACASAALLHFVAFLANQHRYAVGRSASWAMPWASRWSPEGGLAVWVSLAALGSVTIAMTALILYRQSRLRGADGHGSLAVAPAAPRLTQ